MLRGIADSDYLGPENSVAEMANCDIHSEPGVIKCNQRLHKDSGNTVNEFLRAKAPCSNGSTYFFGESGGIYERDGEFGNWHSHGRVRPGSGSAKVMAAREYDGYIYYSMENRLGRIAIPGQGGSWDGRDDDFATFDNGDDTYHPMHIVNQVLYIGDAHHVAQVDAGTFSGNALDIKQPLRISALHNIDTDLLVGTYVSHNVVKSEIIRWDTYSESYTLSDPIEEAGINAFLQGDNIIWVSAGFKGNIYLFNGVQLVHERKIKGDWTAHNEAKVLPEAVANFNSMPLFGLSQVFNSPAPLGIYSYHRSDVKYPRVLNLEYTISTGNRHLIEIGAIAAIGPSEFLVTWKDVNNQLEVKYGVDILDLTHKATAYFTTRNLLIDRDEQNNYGLVHANYRQKHGAINIHVSKNHGDFVLAPSHQDTINLKQTTDNDIGPANVVKTKFEMVPSGNNGSEIEIATNRFNDN